MFKKYKLRSYNFRLAILVIVASLYGIVVINSADSSYTLKQCVGLALGVVIMLVLSFVDYTWILKYYWIIYIINILFLAAVPLIGKGSHGAKRWINLKVFQIQPSELSKILMILVTAKILSMYKDKINDWKFLCILAVVLAIPLALAGAFVLHWSPLAVYACTCLDEVGKIPWVMARFRKYRWVQDLTR